MIAFGPLATMWCTVILQRPQLIILAFCSAFFWLMGLLTLSLFWCIPGLQESSVGTAICAVVFQEIWRALFFRAYQKTEEALLSTGQNAAVPLNDASSAVSAGVGFGTMHAVIVFGSVISNSIDQATVYTDKCPAMSLYLMLALQQLCYSLFHVALMVIAFSAYRSKSPWQTFALIVLHLGGQSTTILNDTQGGCTTAIPLLAAITVLSLMLVWFLLRLTGNRMFRPSRWAPSIMRGAMPGATRETEPQVTMVGALN